MKEFEILRKKIVALTMKQKKMNGDTNVKSRYILLVSEVKYFAISDF